MALSLQEPKVTLCLFISISCPLRVCSTHLAFTFLLYRISVSSLVSAARMAAVDKEAVSHELHKYYCVKTKRKAFE